ncbi:MAG TPA: aldose 1-epimerase family protein, partial [Chryseolinea sp.]|nr:aldose 1-epimerase family protein [Chryseolinea sp.]
MNVTLESDQLKIQVHPKGAELKSVFHKHTGLEYMWNADPAFWAKTSPILFPIVGTLKSDTYLFQGKSYTLSRHGFARDATFELEKHEPDRAIFLLRSTSTSYEKFPFNFELRVTYTIVQNVLEVAYDVNNIDADDMYFSIGGHPAFKVPLTKDTTYEDYYLEFNRIESISRWPISDKGLIEIKPLPMVMNSSILKLTRDLFNEDALVFKNLQSDKVSLKSSTHTHGLEFSYTGFPYLGIWAANKADFVCIEPWCGIADAVSHDQQLISKEGIER